MNDEERWAAVDRLFGEVVDLAPAARAARLDAFPGDPSIRDEVVSLLAALTKDAVRLEPSPGASHLTLLGESAAIPVSLTGRRLGPWAVVREVGRGGMGAVYEAFRADDLFRKRVAVKTLTRGADSEVVARRFQQERQILASLQHPAIATLIDGGVTEEGLPYLVMEFVDGEPIDRYCASRRLPLRGRLDLFRQVCAAVQYAHRNLVVHRDLKPSNILVTSDGNVKLVDFGIAKLLGPHAPGDVTLTETGARAFTTGYASPEQVRGEPISTATDVYSLGASLYRLLAGRLPFDVGRLTPSEVMRAIAELPAPAPSRACTDEAATEAGLAGREALARELAGELDDIVLAALRKEPERRYATVAALSDDLKRYLQGQQVSARPDTWRYRVRAFSRRNRGLVGVATFGLLALVAGAVVSGWQAIQAGRERDRARTEAARSSRVVAFIEQMLAGPAEGALTEATVRGLDQAVERARAELADDPIARGAVYRTAARAYASHNRNERALPLLDSALVLHGSAAGPGSAEVGRDLVILARVAYNRGVLDSAVTYSRRAVDILRATGSDRPDDLPSALLYHSFALTYAGQPVEAARIAEEGIRLAAPRGPSGVLAYLYMARGEAALFQGRFRDTEREYLHSTALYDSLPGPPLVEQGIAELGLASLRTDAGDWQAGEAHARRSLDIVVRNWGPDHAYAGRAHAALARVAAAKGDAALAAAEIAAANRALAQSRLGLVDWIAIEAALSRVLVDLGRPGEAAARLRAALAARPAELERAPQILATTENFLAQALLAMRDAEGARTVLEQVYARATAAFGPRAGLTVSAAARLLFLAAAAGDTAAQARYAPLFPPDSAAAIRARGKAWRR